MQSAALHWFHLELLAPCRDVAYTMCPYLNWRAHGVQIDAIELGCVFPYSSVALMTHRINDRGHLRVCPTTSQCSRTCMNQQESGSLPGGWGGGGGGGY